MPSVAPHEVVRDRLHMAKAVSRSFRFAYQRTSAEALVGSFGFNVDRPLVAPTRNTDHAENDGAMRNDVPSVPLGLYEKAKKVTPHGFQKS